MSKRRSVMLKSPHPKKKQVMQQETTQDNVVGNFFEPNDVFEDENNQLQSLIEACTKVSFCYLLCKRLVLTFC